MQGMFRNPLADPGLIGVSSGAAFGAVLMIVFSFLLPADTPAWFMEFAIPISAFTGAALTTLIIYRLSLVNGRVQVATMLLAGIAVGALVGAAIGYITTKATDDQLRSITFWSLGSLSQVSWSELRVGAPLILGVAIILPFFAKAMNAMLLGDAEAARLGIRVEMTKRVLITLTSIAVGASVASAGTIGFVGLLVPHLVRLCIGPDHRFLLPASALLGATLVVLSDLLARTLTAPAELPLGTITALLGAPFFLYMLLRQKRTLFL
jgi:iron complex transport system permease protein